MIPATRMIALFGVLSDALLVCSGEARDMVTFVPKVGVTDIIAN
jgi:hypothetical protein